MPQGARTWFQDWQTRPREAPRALQEDSREAHKANIADGTKGLLKEFLVLAFSVFRRSKRLLKKLPGPPQGSPRQDVAKRARRRPERVPRWPKK
eukprot:8570631-Pyramimonas_sp.AAC.1